MIRNTAPTGNEHMLVTGYRGWFLGILRRWFRRRWTAARGHVVRGQHGRRHKHVHSDCVLTHPRAAPMTATAHAPGVGLAENARRLAMSQLDRGVLCMRRRQGFFDRSGFTLSHGRAFPA